MRHAILALVMFGVITPLNASKDEPVGKVYFLKKSDGTLQPIYPVRLKVMLESGKVVEKTTSLACEVRSRQRADLDSHVVVVQTVLRCEDGGTYVVVGTIYQGDAR